jgi:hypothetical protein
MPTSPDSPEPRVERLVAEDTRQTIWLRLRRMTSSRLCRQIISARANAITPEVLDHKAEGLAWAVRSALGYWESNPADLNAKVLTRYYAMLQISIAEQVASPNPKFDLEQAQRHTEQGHGLFTLRQPNATFPDSYHVGSVMGGHFYSYCKYLGINLKQYAFEKRPREWAELDQVGQSRLVSVTDLLRRVPELQAVITEYLGAPPLSLHVGYATRNIQIRSQRLRTGQPTDGPTPSGAMETTFIAIYPSGPTVNEEYLKGLNLPVQNITVEHDSATKTSHLVGSFTHPAGDHWWQHLKTYKSGYCGTSLIVPFWGTADPFLIHFVVLYAMSIVVRYLPSLWHEIEDSSFDHIRALIEHYLVIVDSVIPHLAVERITGVRLRVDQPGSLHAPT